MRRYAFVIPWREPERWLWKFLPEGADGDLIFAAPEPGTFLDKRPLPPYLGEMWQLGRKKPNLNGYDAVFAWELRCAVAVSLWRKVTKQKRGVFVAVGPILKGPVLRVLPLVRWLLKDADRIVCFSRIECDEYARLLRLPRERFVFLPSPWTPPKITPPTGDDGYILALGRSGRDYPTLLRAVEGTGLPVVLVADNPSALGGMKPTPNVCVKYNTGIEETHRLIANATLHCIPLQSGGYSAGQSVLLRAMSHGKAVVVSDTPAIRHYIRPNETAVTVPSGDSDALRAALVRLWNDKSERDRIGNQAAQAARDEFGFDRFTARILEIACSVDTI